MISQLENNGVVVKDTNHYLGDPAREVDIKKAGGILVQVKKLSGANAIIMQVQAMQKATNQPTVAYVIEQHRRAPTVVQQASQHVQVTNNLDTLLNWLKGN